METPIKIYCFVTLKVALASVKAHITKTCQCTNDLRSTATANAFKLKMLIELKFVA